MNSIEDLIDFLEKSKGLYFVNKVCDDDRVYVLKRKSKSIFGLSGRVEWAEISMSQFTTDGRIFFVKREGEVGRYTGQAIQDLLKKDFL